MPITSLIAAKQAVIFSKIIFEKHNFIYSVDKMFLVIKIIDFERTGPICYSTIFTYVSSSFFVYSTTRYVPYVHPSLDSILEKCQTFPIVMISLQMKTMPGEQTLQWICSINT